MIKKPKLPDLETSLQEITSLIEQMEQGELNLEQSLAQFERGITLIKHAQQILQKTEQKIQLLTKSNTDEQLKDHKSEE